MSDSFYTDFYKKRAVQLATEVMEAAEEYKNNPDGDAWCKLEHRHRDWAENHVIWRAMRCHKI